MISDVLFQAIQDIEDYQRTRPLAYSGMETELSNLKTVMEGMLLWLDSAGPTVHPDPQLAAVFSAVHTAIRDLDVSAITGAICECDRVVARIRKESEYKNSDE